VLVKERSYISCVDNRATIVFFPQNCIGYCIHCVFFQYWFYMCLVIAGVLTLFEV
jgi:hypothetical protein